MLLDEFDEEKIAVINPSVFKERMSDFPKICIAFFSKTLMEKIILTYNPQIIGNASNATSKFFVYKINIKNVDIAVYHAAVGGPAAAGQFEELIAYGAEKFLFVGCCGCLDGDTELYSIIVPTKALRDEGTSYHYLPASDFVELDKDIINAIENTMKNLGINFKKGISWTTDAFYRETPNKVKRRKQQGAVTVEMEIASLAAVAKFRNIKYGHILYSADNLGNETYDPRILIVNDGEKLKEKEKILPIVFECIDELLKI